MTAEYLGIAALVFAVLALAWYGFALGGFIRPLFLPSPGQVLSRLAELWASGQLFADIGISIYRITFGFFISTIVALPVGILIGSYRRWEAAIEPFVDFIRYMPVVAFVQIKAVAERDSLAGRNGQSVAAGPSPAPMGNTARNRALRHQSPPHMKSPR